jgi:thiol-disulfide isomerase/thioredoxin
LHPLYFPPEEQTVTISDEGRFSCDVDAFAVHPVRLYWAGALVDCYVEAGKQISVMLNPAEISRQQSQAADQRPELGRPAYFEGHLAALSAELKQADFEDPEESDPIAYLQRLYGKTPTELKAFFLDEYQAQIAGIDSLAAGDAYKEILQRAAALRYISNWLQVPSWIDRATIIHNEWHTDQQRMIQYLATRKIDLPEDFYAGLGDFACLNDAASLYVPTLPNYIYEWQADEQLPSLLANAFGTNQGVFFDLITVSQLCESHGSYALIDEAAIETIPLAYRSFVAKKNEALKALLEAQQSKSGVTVHDVSKIPGKEVFAAILSQFRGRPMLIDVWATWCGPCRLANEELKPVKEEIDQLGADIAYIYITGESSPEDIWKFMIPDLPGEHFRLSEDQWNIFGADRELYSVPTYIFVDRTGQVREQLPGYRGVQTMREKLLQLLGR